MLKTLTIKNFQAHKESVINFSDRVTALIGTSHHGKSSIVRALQLFFTQRPRGNRYIRKDQKSCEIEVVCNDTIMKFQRNSTTGKYLIGEEEFSALQGEVPEQILNTFPITSLNIAGQYNPFFLLMDSPGNVASQINVVTHLENADAAIQDIASKLRETKQKVKIYKEDLETEKKELSEIGNVDLYESVLNKAELLNNKIIVTQKKIIGIEAIVTELNTVTEAYEAIQIPEVEDLLQNIESLLKEVKEKQSKYNQILSIVEDIQKVKKQISKYGNIPDNMFELIQEAIDKNEKHKIVVEIFDDCEDVEKEIAACCVDIEKELEKEKELLKQLDRCPSCNQELTDTALSYLVGRSNNENTISR